MKYIYIIYIANILTVPILSHASIEILRWQSHNVIFLKTFIAKLLSI